MVGGLALFPGFTVKLLSAAKAREHWTRPDENPPVGLILCTYKDAAVAKYALECLSNKVLTSEYRTALSDEKLIAEELERTRRILEDRYQVLSLHQKSKRRLISRKCCFRLKKVKK